MIKHLTVTFRMLEQVLGFPAGVVVAAIRQGDYNAADITIIDPNNNMPDVGKYDEQSKQWISNSDGV